MCGHLYIYMYIYMYTFLYIYICISTYVYWLLNYAFWDYVVDRLRFLLYVVLVFCARMVVVLVHPDEVCVCI